MPDVFSKVTELTLTLKSMQAHKDWARHMFASLCKLGTIHPISSKTAIPTTFTNQPRASAFVTFCDINEEKGGALQEELTKLVKLSFQYRDV